MPEELDAVSAPLPLPERPDLRHLRDQARDLVREGHAPTLARAQFLIARRYGFASWPKLKAHVESFQEAHQLKEAIDTEVFDRAREMLTRRPALHRARMGYAGNGPLTWLAECRVPWGPPSAARLEMAQWMIENGSDIHQGGDGPLMRAALNDERIPMMALLVAQGADVNALWNGNYPILCAPCEALPAKRSLPERCNGFWSTARTRVLLPRIMVRRWEWWSGPIPAMRRVGMLVWRRLLRRVSICRIRR